MGSSNSSEPTYEIEISKQRVNSQLNLDCPGDIQKFQFQVIKESRAHLAMQQVCCLFESSLKNPTDENSRNELGNALRQLASRIDRYDEMKNEKLRFIDSKLHDSLLTIGCEIQEISNQLDKVRGVRVLSPEGEYQFRKIAENFVANYRPFCDRLQKAVNELSDYALSRAFQWFKDGYCRFKEFNVENKW